MALFVSAAAVPMQASLSAPIESEGSYLKLGFDKLGDFAFVAPNYDPAADTSAKPAATGEEQIPAVVKGWNGKKAMVTGFMLPVKMENGLVTEFLLMRDQQMCCFSVVPNMNEWVVVKMIKGVPPTLDVPVSFYGELKVGAQFENGYMTGIYELVGERMGEIKG